MITRDYSFALIGVNAALPVRLRELVAYLSSHAGRWVPRAELEDHLYQGVCSKDAISVLVWRLRQRIGQDAIESQEPFGYRIPIATVDYSVCGRCHRQVVWYGDEFACYGCGSTGRRPRDVVPLRRGEFLCAHCGERFEADADKRERDKLRAEQVRGKRAHEVRDFCSLTCARNQLAADRRARRVQRNADATLS